MKDCRLAKVRDFFKKNHRFPSYSEMLGLFKLSSKNAVYKIVRQWIEEGLLKKVNKKISPTKAFFSLPLLGSVKAGPPSLADEDLDFLSLDDYLIDKPEASFLLKVSGDSLLGVGIMPGDLVIIEKKKQASFGQIVLAFIDKQWTLKILKKKNGRVRLESANKKYSPFYPNQELELFGVVRGVIRRVN